MLNHISGYRFIPLDKLESLKSEFFTLGKKWGLLGTILLSREGINVNLCGDSSAISAFQSEMEKYAAFANFTWKTTKISQPVYKKWLVKIKEEIITTGQENLTVPVSDQNHISPAQLHEWLENQEDFVLLDTRNDYEHQTGTFTKAMTLPIENFTDFFDYIKTAYPETLKQKKTVIFCTGGIRCEKALPFMQQQGFSEVYQLDGGILNYFAQYQGQHYRGGCFVFDERLKIDGALEPIYTFYT